MSFGAVAALLIGIAMLIPAFWLGWYLIRRQSRLATWPRAQATVRRLRKEKRRTTVSGTTTTETTIHARYEFRDAAGVEHTGEADHLSKPKVGDAVEVMYDPSDPATNETVRGASVAGRIIHYGAVFVVFGGGGIFLILASLGLT